MASNKALGLSKVAMLTLFASPTLAYQAIAHRGLYHDRNDNYRLAENSVDALYRAHGFGLAGAELDLRLTSDGQVLVSHEVIANRATYEDNYNGRLNPIDVSLNTQPVISAINLNSKPLSFWNDKPLKVYGGEGYIFSRSQLAHFSLFLDIQDPLILTKAAALVKKHGLNDKVYLKFFAKKTIDSTKYKYTGPATCHQYAVDHGFGGLRIIPQFNDGELTVKNNQGFIQVFKTELTVEIYISCWLAAQTRFGRSAARLDMLSASVPLAKDVAFNTAKDALTWPKLIGA